MKDSFPAKQRSRGSHFNHRPHSEAIAAWACWSPYFGLWELETTFDQGFCKSCEAQTTFTWTRIEQPPNIRVRELNNAFRMKGEETGSVVITQGLAALGDPVVERAVAIVRAFDAFTEDNDPYGEHDFGTIEVDEHKIFWKVSANVRYRKKRPSPSQPVYRS